MTGTARYASINALNGLTQSRRDDLESVGYVLLYFLRGKLPWQGLHFKNKEDRYHKIMEIKIETTPYELCKGFPKEYEDYVEYTRKLEYEEDPDYEYLTNLFKSILKEEIDYIYDWDLINKTTNTCTTSNTSKKGIMLKDKKEKNEFKNKDDNKDKVNDGNDNAIEDKDNKASNKAKMQSSHNIKSIDNKRNKNKEETIINYNNNNNVNNELGKNLTKKNDENDYGNIAELTEEEKDKKNCPNISGLIHNKRQIEKDNTNLRRNKDDSCCNIM